MKTYEIIYSIIDANGQRQPAEKLVRAYNKADAKKGFQQRHQANIETECNATLRIDSVEEI